MLSRFPLAGRLASLLALLFCFVAVLAPAADDKTLSPKEAKAQAALKRLQEKIKSGGIATAKLRQELVSFQLAHLGTNSAVKAAELFSEFPSPLDKLDSKTIAELEKFPWQPKELVGILGEHRGRHGGAVTGVAFSPDGKYIVSGGGTYVRIWNTANMRLHGMGGHTSTLCIAFSKDSKVVVSGSSYGSVYVWNVSKEAGLKLRFTVAAATSPVYDVACHPDGKRIAAACFDNVIRVYDISGKKIESVATINGHEKAVRSVAFSNDGKYLATGSDDQSVRIWDATNNDFKLRSRMEGNGTSLISLAFSRTGHLVAAGGSDGSIRLWGMPASARPKAPRVLFKGTKGAVTSMSFSSSSGTLAATGGDGIIRLWNMTTGRLVRERFRLEGHQGVVSSVAYSPDMKLLVSGGDDWTVRTWDLTKPKPVERFIPWSHLSHVYSAAFSTDAASLASGSYDRVVRFWDLARPEPKTRNYLKFDVPVYAVDYSPDGRMVAAGGQSTTIKQWDAATGRNRPALKGNSTWVYRICYSPDSKYLLAASGNDVILYNSAQGGEAKRFGPHKTRVTCIGFSPDSRLALSGSGYYLYDKDNKIVIKNGKYVYHDCVVKLWNIESGEEATEVKDAPTPFYSAAFTADGRQLMAGNYEPVLRRFDFASNKLKETTPWKGSSGYVYGIWPTPDGKHMLIRGLDSRLSLWETATGKRVKDWTFHEQMGGVAVSGDSRHIAVGLGTGVIYVLRIASAKVKETSSTSRK